MLCGCSGEQYKFEEAEVVPESLATRDFSVSGLSSRTAGDSKLEDAQVDEAESTLKEALSLNYEEARALLGRLEYQKGNFDAALQVFQGIDIKSLSQSLSNAIAERMRIHKSRSKGSRLVHGVMSLHSVCLFLQSILLKARSLETLGRLKEAAAECKLILDIVDSALPNGMPVGIRDDYKVQEMFHRALELLPKLWVEAGFMDEAVVAYRRALTKPWNLKPHRLAMVQKDLAVLLLYGSIEATSGPQVEVLELKSPKTTTEEAILLLFILMRKLLYDEMEWDQEIMDHLTFALSICGDFESLADHVEQILPGTYTRIERWYFLALCYTASGQNETAINLLRRISGSSEAKHKPHSQSLLLGAKLCAQDRDQALVGIIFASRLIECAINQDKHLLGQAHKFLGVCYGNAARASLSDSERTLFQREALKSLNYAVQVENEEPETLFSLALENAIQRNLASAFHNAMMYSELVAGSSVIGWKLLVLIVSAEQRLKDAEDIVDLAIDETGKSDQLGFVRLKGVLQTAQDRPKQAIETYRILLALIQEQKEQPLTTNNNYYKVLSEKRLEVETWLDLAKIYIDMEAWHDAELCLGKAKLLDFCAPQCWHTTGQLYKAQEQYKEALVSFLVSLSLDPDYSPSLVLAAESLIKSGSRSLAIAKSFLMSALRLYPTNHTAWWNLGLIAKVEGSLQQAADYFQAAHELKLSAPVQSFVQL
ncbi:hypothetical protein Leryth_026086 [Lithospermum erythrorhizon]|nr:hypothetical protein Leryth_026086 [Lithospermum erythrorhizon]